jgi:hypothetical protein
MMPRKRSLVHAELRRNAHKDGTYQRLLDAQGGVCAICGRKPHAGRKLDVDHAHASLTIRGVLCRGCNLRLTRNHADPTWLRRAADYLERAA